MSQYLDCVDASSGAHQTSKLNVPVVGEASTLPSMPFVLPVTVGNASTNQSISAPCDLRVIKVDGYKTAANGGAGDLVQVFNGATPVTDAISLNIVDTTQFESSTIDDAAAEFSAGDTITVDPTDVTNPSCELYIWCLPL